MIFALLATFWAFTQPLPYVIVQPGPVFNVLGDNSGKPVIEVSGVPTADSPGSLDLLTISEYGSPGNTPSLGEILGAFFSNDKVVYPLEAFYPAGVSQETLRQQEQVDFENSKAAAIAAAKANLPVEVSKSLSVTLRLEKVGGPSGGLMFTLGIIDKATQASLTGGKKIAGTGTITSDGVVGAIGGIHQKMVAAALAGDRFFLAPKENCADVVGYVPSNLKVFPVSNVSEALAVLKVIAKDGDLRKLAVCPAK